MCDPIVKVMRKSQYEVTMLNQQIIILKKEPEAIVASWQYLSRCHLVHNNAILRPSGTQFLEHFRDICET